MGHLNVEIKARCNNQDAIREYLKANNADFRGIDHQIDTYFNVPNGRLKLREGEIENFLIHYERSDQEGPKQSKVTLYTSQPGSTLKEALTKALGILVVVDKEREIYFIENVKFHVDVVENLGTFMEIEAIDKDANIGKDKLNEQCNKYLKEMGIKDENLISVSYSDLLLPSLAVMKSGISK
jgi:adenylate cyclase class 2